MVCSVVLDTYTPIGLLCFSWLAKAKTLKLILISTSSSLVSAVISQINKAKQSQRLNINFSSSTSTMMFTIDMKSSTAEDQLTEKEEEKESFGVPIVAHESPRFSLDSPENEAAMLQYLDEHGYVLIANVVPSVEEIEHAKDLFWQFTESFTKGHVDRYDVKTWDNDNWFQARLANAGIIGCPEFSHSEFNWYGRCLPKVRQAFEAVWFGSSSSSSSTSRSDSKGDRELIVSYDAGNAYRPWAINPSWTTKSNWWHTDQNSLRRDKPRQGKVCVQGLITYYDADLNNTGGFCCLPKTQHDHEAMCARTVYAHHNLTTDYVKVDPADPLLKSHAPAILPLAKAGDLILWDSRLIHANTPGLLAPRNDPEHPIQPLRPEEWHANIPIEATIRENKRDMLIRLVTYVCMVPKSFASPEALDSKKLGLLQCKAAFHWPQEPVTTTKPYDIEQEANGAYRDLKTCSVEMLKLAGFSEEEIEERRYIKHQTGN
jgi:hypothetical protein